MFVGPQVQITRQVLINFSWTSKALLIRHHPCFIMPCTVKKKSLSASQSEHITFLFVSYVFSRDFCIQYAFDPSVPLLMNQILTNSETIDTKYRAHDKIKIQYIIMKITGLLTDPVLITPQADHRTDDMVRNVERT